MFEIITAPRTPPRIICSGCGKPALQAGIAVTDSYGPDGPIRTIEADQPLCGLCVAVRSRERRAAELQS